MGGNMEGFKREIGPGLQTAAGAAMLATGNPAGAMMLGSGIAGLAGGMMPQKPSMQPPQSPPGMQMPMGGAPSPGPATPQSPAPLQTPGANMPMGLPMPKGPAPNPLAPGGMPGGPQGQMMDPALRKLLFGM